MNELLAVTLKYEEDAANFVLDELIPVQGVDIQRCDTVAASVNACSGGEVRSSFRCHLPERLANGNGHRKRQPGNSS